MLVAEWLLRIAGLYLGVGIAFAVAFVIWGVERVDGGARGSPLAFRLLIVPGVAALWPVVLRWWLAPHRGHP